MTERHKRWAEGAESRLRVVVREQKAEIDKLAGELATEKWENKSLREQLAGLAFEVESLKEQLNGRVVPISRVSGRG